MELADPLAVDFAEQKVCNVDLANVSHGKSLEDMPERAETGLHKAPVRVGAIVIIGSTVGHAHQQNWSRRTNSLEAVQLLPQNMIQSDSKTGVAIQKSKGHLPFHISTGSA